MDIQQIQQGLQRYYERVWTETQPAGTTVTISQVENITTGWESELFSFAVADTLGQQTTHIARLHQGSDAGRKALYEFTRLQQLAQAGYPVPQVYGVEESGTLIGKPFFTMEKVQGSTLGALMKAAPSPDAFHALLTQFVDLFVQLHTLDWHSFVTPAQTTQARDDFYFIDQWLRHATARSQGFTAVDFSPVVRWVADQRGVMACHQPSPIHQDFHPENILIRPDGAPVVIDWTTFTIADARIDLAWTLLLVDMHLSTALRKQIQQIYEIRSGQPVAELDSFLVTACFRRLMDLAVSITAGAEQSGMRADAVIAMKANQPAFRRAYELLVALTNLRLPQLETLLVKLA